MPTSVRAVTSSIGAIAPRIASPGGGLRSSVSSSIKSPSVRMISIGPEGGRARVDTSFGKPFVRMKPANSTLNPSGKIFGENGSPRPRTAESVFGPRIEFSKPQPSKTPKVGFTPELSSKVSPRVDANFAQARARNQAQVEQNRANQHLSESANQNVNARNRDNQPDQPVRRSADLLTNSIDFKGLQTIPQVKEPIQEGPAKNAFRGPEAQKFTIIVEAPKPNPVDPIRKAAQPIVRIPFAELPPSIAKNRAPRQVEAAPPIPEPARFAQVLRDWKTLPADAISTNRLVRILGTPKQVEDRRPTTEDGLQIRRKTVIPEPNIQTVEAKPLPKLTVEKVRSFTNLEPLIDLGILTKDQAFQKAEIISAPGVAINSPKVEPRKSTTPQVEGLTTKQQEQLAAFMPLFQENPAVQEQIYQKLGVKAENAQKFVEIMPKVDTKTNLGSEATAAPQERPVLQQAMQVVKLMETSFGFQEDDTELNKKAQALIASIRQTYQLNALGSNEAEMQALVDRTIASSEIVPQKSRSKLSLLLVSLVKSFRVEQAAPPKQAKTEQGPTTEGLHQVHLDVQNKRAKLAVQSIDTAPENEKGEISRDYVVDQFRANNKKPFWSKLTLLLGKSYDGSLDEIIERVKKLKFWEQRKVVAKTIDNSMDEFPAVEPSLEQTTKLVGVKEVGKVLDPALIEKFKALVKAVLTVPQTTAEIA